MQAAHAGYPDGVGLAWLVTLFLAGLNIKEIFYGWSAGIGGMILMCVFMLWRSSPRSAGIALWATLPTIVLPVAHLAWRLQVGALGQRLGDDPGGRYQVEVGANVIINAVMSLAAIFGSGPFHLVEDDEAPFAMRLLPFVTLLASASVLLAALLLYGMHRCVPRCVNVPRLAFLVGAPILSLLVVLPMSSVSELYGMGANAGSALAITAAVISLWQFPSGPDRTFGRAAVVLLVLTFVPIGIYGLVTRAIHNRVTWACASAINRKVLHHQEALSPLSPGAPREVARIYFDPSCRQVRTYSQYVIPPIQAINIWSTEDWMNRRFPDRPVEFRITSPPIRPLPRDLVIDCSTMPDHGHW
jgi:hypothetical protein